MSDRITIVINTGNAAFCDGNFGAELALILRDLADRAERCDDTGDAIGLRCRDSNGNKVGEVYGDNSPTEAALDGLINIATHPKATKAEIKMIAREARRATV